MKRLIAAALIAAISASQAFARDCSGSITTGGTAQNAISALTGMARIDGSMICNLSTSEPLWLNPNGTAAAATAGSAPLQAATAAEPTSARRTLAARSSVARSSSGRNSNLVRADLSGTNLNGADLQAAMLLETNFADADLTGCLIYGVPLRFARLSA
jgi:hypothetical protein